MGINCSKGKQQVKGPKRPKCHKQKRDHSLYSVDSIISLNVDWFIWEEQTADVADRQPAGSPHDTAEVDGYSSNEETDIEQLSPSQPQTKPKPSSASIKPVKQKCDQGLCSVVDTIAAHTRAENVPQLAAALQIQSTAEHRITNTFPGNVRKQATALIHYWIDLQPDPSVEGLLTQLIHGGLNVDWLIREKQTADVADRQPAGSPHDTAEVDGYSSNEETDTEHLPQRQPQTKPKPSSASIKPVKQKRDETLRSGVDVNAHTNAADVPQRLDVGEKEERKKEEGNISKDSQIIIFVSEKQDNHKEREMAMDNRWFLREFNSHFTNIPDPFTKHKDFHKWLRVICLLCHMTPADISMLLDIGYSIRWKEVKDNFSIPSCGWPNIESMATWLDGSCLTSIQKIAQANVDFTSVNCCHQKPKESVEDFLKRYEQVWDSSVGVYTDMYNYFKVSSLVNQLQPRVSEIFKEKLIGWKKYKFDHVKICLEQMEDQGMFESKSRALQTWSKGSRYPRRDKRGDQCSYCGKFGHWARECRTRLCHHPRQLALTYT